MAHPELVQQPPTGAETGHPPGTDLVPDGHTPLTGDETRACDRLFGELLAELAGDTVRSLPVRPTAVPHPAATHIEVA